MNGIPQRAGSSHIRLHSLPEGLKALLDAEHQVLLPCRFQLLLLELLPLLLALLLVDLQAAAFLLQPLDLPLEFLAHVSNAVFNLVLPRAQLSLRPQLGVKLPPEVFDFGVHGELLLAEHLLLLGEILREVPDLRIHRAFLVVKISLFSRVGRLRELYSFLFGVQLPRLLVQRLDGIRVGVPDAAFFLRFDAAQILRQLLQRQHDLLLPHLPLLLQVVASLGALAQLFDDPSLPRLQSLDEGVQRLRFFVLLLFRQPALLALLLDQIPVDFLLLPAQLLQLALGPDQLPVELLERLDLLPDLHFKVEDGPRHLRARPLYRILRHLLDVIRLLGLRIGVFRLSCVCRRWKDAGGRRQGRHGHAWGRKWCSGRSLRCHSWILCIARCGG
mmetsp:Transcript_14277/g.53749  ORF Transcript_14277/g.53749 Transcript_14277/m.53749 type:complete len:387 (-) Transcript_14277:1061-2221(-)